ncbi:Flp pilus assembly protein CpaB [Aquisediminimonas sediminicola]|uniref:Flp pilus assembly protein CpaB n=1 Tax=Alteraquisediminimonas sediminicola TaxID=2676787 RepID=UPI0031B89698
MIALAIVLGLVAVYLANIWLGGVEQKQQQVAAPTMAKVAVARVEMDYGTEITPEMVQIVDMPAANLPQGAFGSMAELLPMNKPRVAIRPIAVNEVILASRVSGENGRASLSALLHPDMRAVSVRVSEASAVAGFVVPGEIVDVLITRTMPSTDGSSGEVTDVLLQQVRVLAMDQNASENTQKPVVSRTATLEVSQVDAQKLALGERAGALSLVLRKSGEAKKDTPNIVTTVSVEDLRDGAYGGGFRNAGPAFVPSAPSMTTTSASPAWRPAKAVRRKPSNQVTVQVVRGTTNTSYEVRRHAGF